MAIVPGAGVVVGQRAAPAEAVAGSDVGLADHARPPARHGVGPELPQQRVVSAK